MSRTLRGAFAASAATPPTCHADHERLGGSVRVVVTGLAGITRRIVAIALGPTSARGRMRLARDGAVASMGIVCMCGSNMLHVLAPVAWGPVFVRLPLLPGQGRYEVPPHGLSAG